MYDQTKKLNSVAIVAQGVSLPDYVWYGIQQGGKDEIAEEVWTINQTGNILKSDLIFQMDDLKVQEMRAEAGNKNVLAMTKWLKKAPAFFTSKVYPDYPGALEYPLEEVVNDIRTPYLNNTVAYAIAYAIYRKVSTVWLFGVDYYDNNKRIEVLENGRACCEFLMGLGHARGINFNVCPHSRLLDTHIPKTKKPYGYDAYNVELTMDNEGKITVHKTDKPLPTPEEVEKDYNHIVNRHNDDNKCEELPKSN